MAAVPTIKAMAVTTKEEYFFKIFLDMVAPITQEVEAMTIKIFPVKASGEIVPVSI